MHDPFPFAAPAALQKAVEPIANYLSLTTLPLHIHEILLAFTLYESIRAVLSPLICSRIWPSTYPRLSRRTKLNWDVHVVSFCQSIIICALALWVMREDGVRKSMADKPDGYRERVWAYTGGSGLVQAWACGYFLWDFWMCARYVEVFGWGMLAHAISAVMVFSLGFRPFVNYYAPIFILYELSSPFLNVHWFCDKLDLTGSTTQLLNGIVLLSTFFGCRLCWGTYNSFRVASDIYRAHLYGPSSLDAAASSVGLGGTGVDGSKPLSDNVMRFVNEGTTIPLWLTLAYLTANLTLNGLNFYWFSQMIKTIRKRFDPPFGTRRPEDTAGGRNMATSEPERYERDGSKAEYTMSTGLYADGRTSVEIEATEVRQRTRGALNGARGFVMADDGVTPADEKVPFL